jgi:hypothetical protein
VRTLADRIDETARDATDARSLVDTARREDPAAGDCVFTRPRDRP